MKSVIPNLEPSHEEPTISEIDNEIRHIWDAIKALNDELFHLKEYTNRMRQGIENYAGLGIVPPRDLK